MKNSTGCYPRVEVDTTDANLVSQAGAVLLVRGAQAAGLDTALTSALAPWTKPLATHRPGKVVLDLAVTLAVGGDCLADVAVLRAEPGLFGRVGSDATVSRAIAALATDAKKSLRALKEARAAGRARAWAAAGAAAPGAGGGPVVIDLDATLVTAHSEKESAAPTYKRGFGFHPLWAFCDHGPDGSGEPLAVLLRAGNAGSNTAADHITVVTDALAQLPPGVRRGRNVLIRTDGAGCTHAFLTWLTARRRNLGYSIGFNLTTKHAEAIAKIPQQAWTPAYDADGDVRDGAWVTDATGMLDLTGWPKGMRVIARKERPHPGAQLTFTDVEGLRLTAFATNTTGPGPGTQLLTWSCGTANAPAPKTASASRKTPACGTCRCTPSLRTRSGCRSCQSPASSPPGPRCSPTPSTQPADRNRRPCGSGRSPPPGGWPVMLAERCFSFPNATHGPSCSPPA